MGTRFRQLLRPAGFVVNSAPTTWLRGSHDVITGGSALFTASDKTHLTIADGDQTDLGMGTADKSLSGWLNFTSVAAGEGGVIYKGGSSSVNGLEIYRDTTSLKAALSRAQVVAHTFTASDKTHLTIADGDQTGLDAGTADFSVGGWVNFASVAAGEGCVVHKGGTDAGTTGCEIYRDTTTLKAHLSVNGQLFTVTIGTVAASTWYHWVVAFDRDGNATGYLNGVAGTPVVIGAQDGQTVSNSVDFYVGSRAGANYFGGSMCMLMFYAKALSSAEVTALYNKGCPVLYAELSAGQKTSLTSMWEMQEALIDGDNDATDSVASNDLSFVAAELVTNGTFDSDSDWAKGTGWSIGSGVATCDGSAGANTYLTQSSKVVIGNVYAATYTVSSYTQGGTRIYIGTGSASVTKTAAGTYTETLTASGNTDILMSSRLSGGVYFGGSMDNVSVKSTRLNATTGPGPGSGVARDVQGQNHAVLQGRTAAQMVTDWRNDLPTALQGTRSYSLYHDGTDDSQLLPVAAIRTACLGAAAITFSVWVKLVALKGNGSSEYTDAFFTCYNSAGNNAIHINLLSDANARKVHAAVRSQDGDSLQKKYSDDALVVGQWHHVAVVLDFANDKMHFYIDGSSSGGEQSVTWGSATFATTAYTLGDRMVPPTYPLNANLADMRFYSSVLSAAQIAELYAGNEATAATPVAHWTFDEGGGSRPTINLGTIAASTWYHAAVSVDRDGFMRGYLNGTACTPVDVSMLAMDLDNSTDFYLGSRAGANYFGGSLCGVGVWDKCLSSGEVTALQSVVYHGDLSAGQLADLVSWWDLNEQVLDGTHDAIDDVGSNDLGFVAAELLSNTGFETAGAGGADVFANWTESTSGTSTINDETSVVHGGSHSCRFDVDASNSAVELASPSGQLTVGNSYSFTLWAQASSGTPTIEMALAAYVPKTLSTSWQQFSVNTEAAATRVFFKRGGATSTSIYFDDVSVTASRLNTSNGPAVAVASDSIGTNHATLQGRTSATMISDWRTDLPTALQGTRSYSLYHSGSAGVYEDCINPVKGATSCSVSVWCTRETFVQYAAIINTWSGSFSAQGWMLGYDDHATNRTIYWLIGTGSGSKSIQSDIPVTAGTTWYHIVGTYNGATGDIAVWINGVGKTGSVAAGAIVASEASSTMRGIGRYSTNEWIGKIADCRIYNVALSADQVAELYAGSEATAATPIAHWTFDDGPQGTPGQDSPIINWQDWLNTGQLYQGTLSKTPSYDLAVIGANPGLFADGVDDYLWRADTSLIPNASGGSFFAGQLGPTALSGDQVLLSCSDTASANYYWEIGINSSGKVYVETKNNATVNRVTGNSALEPEDNFVIGYRSSGSAWSLWVNGTLQTLTATTGSNTGDMPADITRLDNTVLFGKVNNSGLVREFEGYLLEVRLYDSPPSLSEMLRISSRLMSTYGITD